MSITKEILSSSSFGAPVALTTTYTTLHVCSSTASYFDQVLLYANNPSSTASTLQFRILASTTLEPYKKEINAVNGSELAETYYMGTGAVIQAKGQYLYVHGEVNRIAT